MNVWLEAPVQKRNVPFKLAGTTAATCQNPTLMHRHERHTVEQMTWFGLSVHSQSSGGLFSVLVERNGPNGMLTQRELTQHSPIRAHSCRCRPSQ